MRQLMMAACAALLVGGAAQAATAIPDVNGAFQLSGSYHGFSLSEINVQQLIVDVTLDPLTAVDFSGSYDHVYFAEYDGPPNYYNPNGETGVLPTSVTSTSTGYQIIFNPPQTTALCYPLSVLTACGEWYYDQTFYVFGQGSSDQPVDYTIAFHEVGRSHISAPIPEPATWALSLIGFGLVGAALRRRPAGASLAG